MKLSRAFEIPARCAEPRHREVVVEDRLRVFVVRSRFAAEEPPPSQVTGIGDVRVGDVHGFVVHQRVHALAARHRLQRAARWGDVQHHAIVRRRAGARISVVREVGHQHHGLFGRRPFEDPPLELQGVVVGRSRRGASDRSGRDRDRAAGDRRSRAGPSRRDRRATGSGGQQCGDPQARDEAGREEGPPAPAPAAL